MFNNLDLFNALSLSFSFLFLLRKVYLLKTPYLEKNEFVKRLLNERKSPRESLLKNSQRDSRNVKQIGVVKRESGVEPSTR
jgi:hypothetical protein